MANGSSSERVDPEARASDATRVVAKSPEPTREDPQALPRGTTVARYVLLERLGGGGMGVVYKAYDPELAREVAIKLLRPDRATDGSSQEMGRRLQREAQALAQVSHPNVIAVHDVGTWHQHIFIAMELVHGVTLGDWLRANERPAREVLETFIAAGEGLSAAHRAGIVHRDFKPSNVIVAEDGRIRVLDFGLARGAEEQTDSDAHETPDRPAARADPSQLKKPSGNITEPTDPTGSRTPSSLLSAASASVADSSLSPSLAEPLTVAGTVMGTPGYMSPEQQRGQRTDARTDQFSFAVALYEALAGERPFSKRAFRIGAAPASPPSYKRIPANVRKVLTRALSEHPDSRFPTMDEMLAQLRRLTRRRQRPWVILAAAVVVAIPVSVLMAMPTTPPCQGSEAQIESVWNGSIQSEVKNAFVATGRAHASELFDKFSASVDSFADRWATAHQDACEATHVRHEQSEAMLDTRMACLKRERHKLESLLGLLRTAKEPGPFEKATMAVVKLDSIEGCSRTEELLASDPLPSDPEERQLTMGLLQELDRSYVMQEAGHYTEALQLARKTAQRAEQLEYGRLRARAMFRQGALQISTGKWDEGEQAVIEALRWAAPTDDKILQADAWLVLMNVKSLKQARFDEAEQLQLPADLAILASGNQPRLRARLLTMKAGLAKSRGDLTRALQFLEEAVALFPETGPVSAEQFEVLNMLGIVLMHRGDLARSAQVLRRVADLQEQLLGSHHPHVSVPLSNLATVQHRRGNQEQAEALYRRVLTIDEATFGKEHPWICEDLNNLGRILISRHRFDEAAETLERGLSIAERTVGTEHMITGTLLLNLGWLALEQEHLEQSEGYFQRALPILEKVGINALPELHMLWGRLHTVRGDFAAARTSFGAARERHEAAGSIETTAAGELFWHQGKMELAADELTSAAQALETAIELWKQDESAEFTSQLTRARLMLASTYWRIGDKAKAIDVAKTARDHLDGPGASRFEQERALVDDWVATHTVTTQTPSESDHAE